jgi:plasmid stabilization system protein ParE
VTADDVTRSHRFRWLPEASQDLSEARDWYVSQRPGLGAEFIAQFWLTIDKIDENPWLLRVRELSESGEPVRSWHFEGRWPYSVVYMTDDEDTVIITAVHHDRRHPSHWADRIRRPR